MAGKIALAWNPDPDPTAVGYMLHFGIASHLYTASLDAGTQTTLTMGGLTPGIAYYFAVAAYNSEGVEGPLSDELITRVRLLPMILTQPSSVIAPPGSPVLLFVNAFGAPPITFQWFNGASQVNAATNSVLIFPELSGAEAGNYTVVVSGNGGSVTSAVASVTVLGPIEMLRSASATLGSTIGAGSTSATADMVVKPSPPVSMAFAAGTYNGLFYETDNLGNPVISVQTTGLLSQCVVDSLGNYNGTIVVSGQSNFISGVLNSAGNGNTTVDRATNGLSDLGVALHFDLAGTLEMTGTVTNLDAANPWTCALIAEAQTNSTEQSPDFLLALPLISGLTGGSVLGMETGEGVSLFGSLGDGSRFTQVAPVSINGNVPLFVQLNNGSGLLAGWVNVFGKPATTPVTWICPASEHQAGFTNVLEATVASFSPSELSSEPDGE